MGFFLPGWAIPPKLWLSHLYLRVCRLGRRFFHTKRSGKSSECLLLFGIGVYPNLDETNQRNAATSEFCWIVQTNDSCLLPGTSSNLRRSKNRYTVLWLSISWRSHKTSVWGPANNRCPQGGTLEAIASTGYSSNHHSIWDLGNSDRPRRMKIYPP